MNLSTPVLIHAPVNHIGILQRQFDDRSYKEHIFYFHKNVIKCT
jgi:hypothetical protein